MLRSVALKDYMESNPAQLGPDASVFEAIHQIIVNKISGVCVVDENNQLLGVLSEIDCMRAVLSATYNEQAVGTVSEFMTREVVTAGPDDDIIQVAADMLAKKHRRRPVVNNGKLIGQISCRRILRAVKDFAAPHDPSEWK